MKAPPAKKSAPKKEKTPRDARAFWPPADVEMMLWFLNSTGDDRDPLSQTTAWRARNFKIDGNVVDRETFRREQAEYRELVNALLCRKGRPTPELRARLKRKGERFFLEPVVMKDLDDWIAVDGRNEDLEKLHGEFVEEKRAEWIRKGGKPEEFKVPESEYPDWLLNRYLTSNRLGEDGKRHFTEADSPLRHFELKEGRLNDHLAGLYDYLFEAADKKKREIRRCRCGTYFYVWPQGPGARSCSPTCRARQWRHENRDRFNKYQKMDRRKRRKKPAKSAGR